MSVDFGGYILHHDHSPLCKKAWGAFTDDQIDNALEIFKQATDEEETAHTHFGMASCFYKQNNLIKAVQHLIKAVSLNPGFHQAFSFMGEIYLSQGQGMAALENYAQAVAYDPENKVYKQRLILLASGAKFKKVNPNFKGVLLACLEDRTMEVTHMGQTWLSLFSKSAEVGPIYKFAGKSTYDAFKKAIGALPNLDRLIEPFFLTGLGLFSVPDYEFEKWITYLRRYLLESVVEGRVLFTDESDLELISCAVMRYCVFTDYVLYVSEEEKKLVETLLQRVRSSKSIILSDLATLGCYKPLYELENAEDIAKALKGGDHVSQIPKEYIEEYFALEDIKKNITAFCEIEDEVSKSVQGQYEVFPYPRWRIASKNTYNSEAEKSLKGAKAEILIAGCGTGQEALQMAYAFPDAQITAVDLSRSSLAYAIYKTQQAGVNNIQYLQGDIMELGRLGKKFDYISSSGVLHHLKDPKAGWSVLNGLLKDGGYMRIALYSSTARKGINAARSVIEEKNIGDDADSIRKFRHEAAQHLLHKTRKGLGQSRDYFSLPECRDLLFHVQEHQFDLPTIKGILDEFGLEFLTFHFAPEVLEKYKRVHKDDPKATNLESWAKWEAKNPDLFIEMYAFWCRKNNAA